MLTDNGTEESLTNSKIANYHRRVKCGEKPVKTGTLSLEYEDGSMSMKLHSFEDRFDGCIASKLFIGAFGQAGIGKILYGWFTDCRTKVKLKFECDGITNSVKVFGFRWNELVKLDKRAEYCSSDYTCPVVYMIPTFDMMCVELIENGEEAESYEATKEAEAEADAREVAREAGAARLKEVARFNEEEALVLEALSEDLEAKIAVYGEAEFEITKEFQTIYVNSLK